MRQDWHRRGSWSVWALGRVEFLSQRTRTLAKGRALRYLGFGTAFGYHGHPLLPHVPVQHELVDDLGEPMSQETRKDPRAKVLSMTVRYKSATLDEFIEHHSYDVSRGGMFIKTPKPFPPGTLLKFEVKIGEDQRVMQGVGRVVWKRNPPDVEEAQPAGMGVKFIKLDDESKAVIDQLVARRRDEESAFDRADEVTPAAGVAALKAQQAERSKAPDPGEPGSSAAPQAQDDTGTFFPTTDPERDAPPREDRTLMKQAAELLQDALREAGGSVEELGEKSDAEDTASGGAAAQQRAKDKRGHHAASAPAGRPSRSAPAHAAAVAADAGEGTPKPSASPRKGGPPSARAAALERRPTPEAAAPDDHGGGGGKLLVLLLGVAAAVALVFYMTRAPRQDIAPAPEPLTPAMDAEEPAPAPAPAETQTVPAAAADAAGATGADAAAPDAGAAALQDAAAPVPEVEPEPVAVPTTRSPAPPPRPAAQPRPRPRPRPAEPAAPESPAPAPQEPVPAPQEDAPEPGPEQSPGAAPSATVSPSPAPAAPAPTTDENQSPEPPPPPSDNPYE